MAKIGGFDPGLGLTAFTDGAREVGRANLPGAARMIPTSEAAAIPDAAVYGRLTDSGLREKFAAYLAPRFKHRELLAPDVFFEALARAAEEFENADAGGDSDGQPKEGPMAAAARALREALADRELCEMLRRLVLRA